MPRLDVLAIGDAVVDVIAAADEAFLAARGLAKGTMRLLDPEAARRLYDSMGPAREVSGGSAANTAVGVAHLGGRAGFVGLVADDQLGEIFVHDIRAHGVEYRTPPLRDALPTGRVLILVTPDGQRTMCTSPGASHDLTAAMLDPAQIRDAAILLLDGYLWGAATSRPAVMAAVAIARAAGRRIAFTVSESLWMPERKAAFRTLLAEGMIDILFCSETELEVVTGLADFDAAVAAARAQVPLLVVTQGSAGALACANGACVRVAATPVEAVVDTTGAGDMFAAGFLASHARGAALADSLRAGADAAAEVVTCVGARPLSMTVRA